MKRHNFFADEERLAALEHIAEAEGGSVSDLLREGIDRVLAARAARDDLSDRAALRERAQAFLARHRGVHALPHSEAEIEDLIDEVTGATTAASKSPSAGAAVRARSRRAKRPRRADGG